MSAGGDDFVSTSPRPGCRLHLSPSSRFKTVRADLYLRLPLRPGDNTRLALAARLLERGTRNHPDMANLGRAVDALDGAVVGAEVDQLGSWQLLHLFLEVLDSRYVSRRGTDLLTPGLALLAELATAPVEVDGGFRADWLRQEKASLRLQLASLFNDKSAWAQRRCIELMCAGEACGLSCLGEAAALPGIRPRPLMRFYRDVLATCPVDLFVSGYLGAPPCLDLEALTGWGGASVAAWAEPVPARPRPRRRPRRVTEREQVSQARLVLGYRTRTQLGSPAYPALALFNLVWGGDCGSRLFRHIRERAGLCYYIGSHLEPLSGLVFVAAGVETADSDAVVDAIEAQRQHLAAGHVLPAELHGARSLLLNRLAALDDDRAALVRLGYRNLLAGIPLGRQTVRQSLAAVDRAAVAAAAAELRLDTVYLLAGGPA
jgi:predicted Zn-dependent peptidase